MEKKQNKLPAVGFIVLASIPKEWLLFESGALSSFSTFAIIQDGNKRLSIEIEFKKVISPLRNNSETIVINLDSNLDREKTSGITRATQFFTNIIDKETWIIFGHIKGENETPIIILHYEFLDVSIYAKKLAEEEIETFLSSIAPFSKN